MLLIAEVVSRKIHFISSGPVTLDLNGNEKIISYIKPSAYFRVSTQDYDAVTGITKEGYRRPEAQGDPDVLFVGDSFTYAQGVEDHQTFSALYCKAKKMSCANLGVPGASTLYEIDRLEAYLAKKKWRPKEVKFFFFTGNDFADNTEANEKRLKGVSYVPSPAILHPQRSQGFKKMIQLALKHSNLARIAYFKVLPLIRNSKEDNKGSLKKALAITKDEFSRLEQLSKKYHFRYELYVFYTDEEINNNRYQELGKQLQAQTQKPLIHLVQLFKKSTLDDYFPVDGHLTVKGNQKVADFLLGNNP